MSYVQIESFVLFCMQEKHRMASSTKFDDSDPDIVTWVPPSSTSTLIIALENK